MHSIIVHRPRSSQMLSIRFSCLNHRCFGAPDAAGLVSIIDGSRADAQRLGPIICASRSWLGGEPREHVDASAAAAWDLGEITLAPVGRRHVPGNGDEAWKRRRPWRNDLEKKKETASLADEIWFPRSPAIRLKSPKVSARRSAARAGGVCVSPPDEKPSEACLEIPPARLSPNSPCRKEGVDERRAPGTKSWHTCVTCTWSLGAPRDPNAPDSGYRGGVSTVPWAVTCHPADVSDGSSFPVPSEPSSWNPHSEDRQHPS